MIGPAERGSAALSDLPLTGFTSERMWRDAVHFQDIWRATPRLAVNYGVRYDYIGPDTARKPGGLVNFNPAAGELLLAGLGDVSRSANVEPNYRNFAPRVGLAYREALRLDPNLPGVHRALGVALLNSGTDAAAEYELGEICWLQDQPVAALDHFSRALEVECPRATGAR